MSRATKDKRIGRKVVGRQEDATTARPSLVDLRALRLQMSAPSPPLSPAPDLLVGSCGAGHWCAALQHNFSEI
jgi:hypothetical protein